MTYSPPPIDPSTGDLQEQTLYTLEEIGSAIESVASAKGVAADLRVTLLSGVLTSLGTVSTVTGVTTVTTVTTVGTVTNITNAGTLAGVTAIGAQPATTFLPAQNNMAAVLSNINNVIVS